MQQSSRSDVEDLAENEQVFGFLLALHGAVHFLGAALSWRLFEVHNFRYDDVWPTAGTWPAGLAGALWFAAAGSLILVGTRLAQRRPVSRWQLAGPLVLSLAMTLTAVPSALAGTAVDSAILLAMTVLAIRRAGVSS